MVILIIDVFCGAKKLAEGRRTAREYQRNERSVNRPIVSREDGVKSVNEFLPWPNGVAGPQCYLVSTARRTGGFVVRELELVTGSVQMRKCCGCTR